MWFLLACAAGPKDAAPVAPSAGLLVTTVAADYTVGALALLDPATATVYDDLASLSSDPGIQVDGDEVFEINRLGFDTVRVYQPGHWGAPSLELSTGTGSNPQAVARCADRLFVTLLSASELAIYDPTSGVRAGTVDLTPWADDDGIPEAASMVEGTVEGDGVLWVALQRLHQNAGWTSTDGQIVEVECASGTVTDAWEVGPSPSLAADPSDPGALLVRTGIYYDPDGTVLLDGAISRLDRASGALTELVSEAALGANLTGLAVADGVGTALVLSSDASSVYSVHCLDLASGALADAGTSTAFLTAAAFDDDGDAWVAGRPSWADPEAPGALTRYDVGTCASVGAPLTTTLPPYDLAWL